VKTHELKCWPEPFDATWGGAKPYEIRVDDRDYAVGDQLHLKRWDPKAAVFTGKEILVRISYMSKGGTWGLPVGYCVLGLEREMWRMREKEVVAI